LIINERATFLDKMNSAGIGDSFNVWSGGKNYVVTKLSNTRFKVVKGKGYDKSADNYIDKCYIGSTDEVTENALRNFIKMINRKNGFREALDSESESEVK